MYQDEVSPEHRKAVDAHFDSLSKAEQRAARKAGFVPYRELPKVTPFFCAMEFDDQQACHRLRQEDGPDATVRHQTFTREQVLGILSVLLDSIGSKRCAYLRGQTEVVRLGIGIGSRHSLGAIAKMLNLRSKASVHGQVEAIKRKLNAHGFAQDGAKGVQRNLLKRAILSRGSPRHA